MMTNCYEGLRGVGWKGQRAAGLAPEEIERLAEEAKHDLTCGRHRVYAVA